MKPAGFIAGVGSESEGAKGRRYLAHQTSKSWQALCFSYVENITSIPPQLYSQPIAITCFTDDPTMLVDKELSTKHLPLWWARSFLLKLMLSIFQIIFLFWKVKPKDIFFYLQFAICLLWSSKQTLQDTGYKMTGTPTLGRNILL